MTEQRDQRASQHVCDYENSSYRTDFWEGQGREYEDAVERQALRAFLPASGRRLLDIGAGFGRLADLYDGYEQVILFDYSVSQLEYARQRLGDERFIYVAGDLYHLPLASNAVDTAVMVRVLHHIAAVPEALCQISRVLCPQGLFVLEFANKRHLKNVLRYLLRGSVNPFDPQPYEFAKLHFDFHPTWVAQRLAAAGFHIEAQRSVSVLRAGLLKRTIPSSTLAAADRAMQWLTTPLALGPSIFTSNRLSKTGSTELALTAALFRCPSCGHEPLTRRDDRMFCAACQGQWSIEKGIYVFK